MPIVDIRIVLAAQQPPDMGRAQALASAIGRVLAAAPGRVWVRLHPHPASAYAENDAPLQPHELPVFVTLLHAHPPQGDALAQEVQALTAAIAQCLDRPEKRVHIEYAPAGAGRIAFGGRLVE